MEASMNTYEVITDVPDGNTYQKIDADGWRWERPNVLVAGQSLGGNETLLVFLLQNEVVAQFKSEHLVRWSIKQG
jgi:hypothetical protein